MALYLAIAMIACLRVGAAGVPAGIDGCPKDAPRVGTVCARLGSCVLVVLAEGITLQPDAQLLVGRPALLVAAAKGKTKLEAWGNWQEAGRITVRVLRGTRCCIAFVTQEKEQLGVDGKPAPNIRPGDRVCRLPGGASPTAGKPATPPGR